MARKGLKACTKCNYITHDDFCPICQNETSENIRGLLIILDPVHSEVAKIAQKDIKGKYALSVK
ncbi:transcription elongation factor subunit Spt4 [Methanococcus voltae]|jgi:DNA-directed RNA polymerase subunit E"|uniref:DNA-directed RNA polymerase subunit E n=2 Tax=Methanococcus voltae TaxID=2188 RepID=A0A8J7USF8_METVO|nr:transcription elongation factor subunit Spt4 [Methanococcus voltae]MBP2172496.1 DNA-directed RNA polymerase subunit E' [Methanococcus voltae]MBP2201597.1 DNA-directed RNA polymerase subunit E' [Methanococcus voltae]MCS3922386.1 DNA-directed RNA polymerase subunit E' [Methanococcus voltae PS]